MGMTYVEVRSVRIICDPDLQSRVLEQVRDLGASGFTWWEVHGLGHREAVPDVQTASGWHRSLGGESRIVIEVWCTQSVAEKILAYCQDRQFKGIGMIAAMVPLLIHEDEAAKFPTKSQTE
jgi:nitrogen regulatory protein PII